MANTLESSLPTPDTVADRTESRFRWIGWSSFLLAIVQSVCTIFVALSGLRLLLGAAAFASAIGAMQIVERIHVDTIRIPMVMFALAGALFNLVAWRQKPVSRGKFASEGLQLALSLVTLLLLSLESFYHVRFTHHL